jgi:hypothetical protein
MDADLIELVRAAIQAPSGDNTQPWRFAIDEQHHRIAFYVDETRDPSPMNAGQRMARIAVGAALENLLRVAERNGWQPELESSAPPAAALVRLRQGAGSPRPADETIAARVTNRRVYDGRPLPQEVWNDLKAQRFELEGVQVSWIEDTARIRKLGDLIGRADAVMFAEPSMRRAFLANVRFDAPPDAEVEEGLSLASLELAASDRVALSVIARMPNWLIKAAGAPKFFAKHARKLVASAAGLCLVVAPDNAAPTDIQVGRVVERAWLALTAKNLAVQPMSSLMVLENALEFGSQNLVESLGRKQIESFKAEFRALAPEIGAGRPAFLLRFGFGPAVSGRTGRLPVQAVVESRSLDAIGASPTRLATR